MSSIFPAKAKSWGRILFFWNSAACYGCGGLPPPAASDGPAPTVRLEPAADRTAVPRVLRLEISGPKADELFDVRLFAGELSSSQLRRFMSGDPPASLLERQVPCARYIHKNVLVVAPLSELSPATEYRLVSRSHGLLNAFEVAPDASPALERIFPPVDSEIKLVLDEFAPYGDQESGSDEAEDTLVYAVYCGPKKPTQTMLSGAEVAGEAELCPAALSATVSAGVGTDALDAERCLTLSARGAKAAPFAVPPPSVGGKWLDPAPLELTGQEPPKSVACSTNSYNLGPGCVRVMDDRLIIEPAPSSWLWEFAANELRFWGVTVPDQGLSLRGLTPGVEYSLSGRAVDPFGNAVPVQATLTTLDQGEHVVINEVYPDPIGPEPAQEWVELVNDGISSVDLGGYILEDSGGSTVLPQANLAPGQFAVVVRVDFEPTLDLAPAIDSIVVQVSEIGQGGLSNSGEQLELFTPDGQLASEFPMLPKPKEGISVARRTPQTLDDDPNGFSLHAEPGASPGAPNQLAE